MSISAPRKVLLVAYYFHPDLEVGAVRSVKFAKFLPEFGWQPIVLTVKTSEIPRSDSTPLPFDCIVHRTGKWPTIGGIYSKLMQLIKSRRSESPAESQGLSTRRIEADFKSDAPQPLWKRAFMWVFWTPDYQIGWLVPGTWRAVRAVYRENIDLIYASGPPRTGHWIGFLTSILTGRPLVLDYRDPLVKLKKPSKSPEPIELRIDRWIERLVIRRSALVLTTTPEYRDVLKQVHFPHLEARCFAILNGFDAEDFPVAPVDHHQPERPIHFLYAGTLYEGRDPRQFVAALGELVREGFLLSKDIVVEFFGPVEINPAPLQEIIAREGLSDVIEFRALVERKEYLRLIRKAHVLILLQSEKSPTQIPAKTFEYIATGNEVLAIAPAGATTNFLRRFENAHIASPEDHLAIKEQIKQIVKRLASGMHDRAKNMDSLGHLHKRELTRELAKLLDDVVRADS